MIRGEIGRRIELTIRQNLLNLDLDRDFIGHFEVRESGAPGDYVGLGKLVDALVRFAAWKGQSDLKSLKESVLARIRATQEPDGYIGVFKPGERGWKLWDLHEMAYLVAGLTSDYALHGEEASLESAEKLMQYIMGTVNDEQLEAFKRQGITFANASIGLERAFMGLYQATGKESYLEFGLEHTGLREWDWPILMNAKGHAYTYMARCLEQLELFRLIGDAKLLGQSHRVIQFLLAENGLVITGGLSQMERWTDNQFGQHALAETCAVAYLLKLLDSLLRIEGNTLYGDVMERVVFNTLFAAQSPDGRKIRYFTPFEGERHYFNKDTYCCPGNFRRVMSDLGAMVYYQASDGLMVNLYTSSEATLEIRPGEFVTVSQETDFPTDGRVRLTVDASPGSEWALHLRIPRWARKARAAVNGEDTTEPVEAGKALVLHRRWVPGDQVELEMPMPLRAVRGREMQSRHVAVMRGPLVFGVNTTRQSMHLESELPLIRLDPRNLEGPGPDSSVRPGGLVVRGRGWSKRTGINGSPDLDLEFSEFIDPGIRRIYFMTPDLLDEVIEDDELHLPGLQVGG
ncbi:MAG: beta-L-arabinofuranosidase domain-containing protein [Opitutales bacterium]